MGGHERRQVLLQVVTGALQRRHRVVELVGHARRQLAEGGEALLGQQLQARLLQSSQRLRGLRTLGLNSRGQLDLLHLQDFRA